MSSAIRTTATVPRIVDVEPPSLDCCNKCPERTSPFPFPRLPMRGIIGRIWRRWCEWSKAWGVYLREYTKG